MEVDINNLTSLKLNVSFFKKITEEILKKENKKDYCVSIVLVDEEKIRKINKKYRKKDKATDVLSFSYSGLDNFWDNQMLGEIFICPSQIKKQKKEIARVLIHGILHLLEYDHDENGKEAKKMVKKENKYLSLFFKNEKP